MADPDVEAGFQQFIDEPGSRGSQLRDAFAQLLAQGQGGAVPAEALWARQGLDQLKPFAALGQPPDVMRGPVMGQPSPPTGPGTPMPQIQSADPNLDFPTAMPPGAPQKPFPGAKDIKIRPYGMPPSPRKKKKKDKG